MASEKAEKKSTQQKFDEYIEYVKLELEKQNRRVLFADNTWYEYRDGVWRQWTIAEMKAFKPLLHRVGSARDFNISTNWANVWQTLEAALGSEKPIEFDRVPMIVCSNGTYFLKDDVLKKNKPDYYATRRVDVEFDPEAEAPLWEAGLERMFEDYDTKDREQIIGCLQEWLGVALVGGGSRNLRKGMFLYGESGTGKSSVADVLTELLGGEKRIAAPSIASLSTRFGLESLLGKSALISNEAADARTQADAAALKALITGEPQQVDRKGKEAITFRFNGPVLFATNEMPSVSETTSALYDRFIVLEFKRQFSEDDVKETLGGYPSFVAYMRGENQFPGILNWCLRGYDRAVERGSFAVPPVVRTATESFRRRNDKVYDFVKTCLKYRKGKGCSTTGLSGACVEYIAANHNTPVSMHAAGNNLARVIGREIPGVKREYDYRDKAQFRAFLNVELTEEGMKYAELCLTKPQQYPGFKEHIRRLNYSIGNA